MESPRREARWGSKPTHSTSVGQHTGEERPVWGAWEGRERVHRLTPGGRLYPGLASLCRYNAVTGEWLEDEVLIKMASQVSLPQPHVGRAECGFLLSRLLSLLPPFHTHVTNFGAFFLLLCIYFLFITVL